VEPGWQTPTALTLEESEEARAKMEHRVPCFSEVDLPGLHHAASSADLAKSETIVEGQQEAATDASASDLISVFAPEETVIIFDWDDTLFPTWFISEVVIPCTDNSETRPAGQSRWDQPLPEDSPFAEVLRKHATTIEETLRSARSVGRVGIVTLSQRPWVQSSASRYLPDFDLDPLLEELQIPVIYARECVARQMVSRAEQMQEEGVNVMTIAKQAAMLKALKKLYGKKPWKNVISIGDSIVERDAITDVLWSRDDLESPPCCKTVKLVEDPSMEQLRAELVLLGMWLHSMAAHGEDFDVVMDESEEEMLRIHKRFCTETGTS
jgi:hypothetical protein